MRVIVCLSAGKRVHVFVDVLVPVLCAQVCTIVIHQYLFFLISLEHNCLLILDNIS